MRRVESTPAPHDEYRRRFHCLRNAIARKVDTGSYAFTLHIGFLSYIFQDQYLAL